MFKSLVVIKIKHECEYEYDSKMDFERNITKNELGFNTILFSKENQAFKRAFFLDNI